MKLCTCFGISLSSNQFCLRVTFVSNLGLIMAQQISIHVNCFLAGDDTPCAFLSQKCLLWERGLVTLPQPWGISLPEMGPNPCPLSPWCQPTISSSVVPSCPQSFPTSGSLQMTQLFSSGGQSIGVLASASVLPMDNQDWFPLGWTGRISLQSKGLSRVFSLRTTCLVAMGIRCLWLNWPPRLTNMKFHAKISHFQKDCNNPLCSQSPL